ncbi:MAG: energy transducer TonB [Candidatus Krumholzibacteriota bacterium]|nr:energy transducer TonB [Candidatus Krumholzibacteriota bacterium]
MVITVQQLVKKGYPTIMRWSLLGAVVIVAISFLFSPDYNVTPYRLREEIFEVVEIPEDIEIPPPPQDIAPPRVPVQIEISDEASDDETIEDTTFDFAEDIPPPVVAGSQSGPQMFTAFDDPPVPIYRVKPRYPDLAREAEMEGTVTVLITVDERGNVMNVVPIAASVPQILIDEAVRAAQKWRFKPGKQRNVPVPCTISATLEFKISR